MKFKLVSDNSRKVTLNIDRINLYVSRYKPGTPFDFEIVRRQAKRSDPMRKLYFGKVLNDFMNHLGYEPEDELFFHRQLKIVYFKVKPDKRGIYREKDIPSVFSNESDLSVGEKKNFVDWVIRKAAEHGVYIEDPQ